MHLHNKPINNKKQISLLNKAKIADDMNKFHLCGKNSLYICELLIHINIFSVKFTNFFFL